MVYIKQLVELIEINLVRLWSFVFTYGVSQKFKRKYNFFYSIWISNFIGEVGKGCVFKYPLRLEGGGNHFIRIGESTSIQAYSILGCWVRYGDKEHYNPEIIIGNHCNIGEYCHITAINKITIGDGLLTGRFVYIGDNAHGGLSWEEAVTPPIQRCLKSRGEIVIGKNVWIGDKVSIFGGVTIGDNVIIGAGSIVTHDIPSNCIAVGAPVKIVKTLN